VTTKKEALMRQEFNIRLREECLAGYGIVFDHPIVCLSLELANEILAVSRSGDHWEEVINQLARSLTSAGANFVEGVARSSAQERQRFLRISRGSAYESIFHARLLYKEIPQRYLDLADMVDKFLVGTLIDGTDLTEGGD